MYINICSFTSRMWKEENLEAWRRIHFKMVNYFIDVVNSFPRVSTN